MGAYADQFATLNVSEEVKNVVRKIVDESQNAHELVKTLWVKACEFDGMPEDAAFAAFSKENPYAFYHNMFLGAFFLAGSQL